MWTFISLFQIELASLDEAWQRLKFNREIKGKMLIDGFWKKVDYLRVSVTERCNFRCQYCMPEKPFLGFPKRTFFSYEDLFKFIKLQYR